MSMFEKKNKQIDMLKYWLSILVLTFLGIGAYLVTNIKNVDDWLIVVSCFSLIGLFVAVVLITQRINKLIDDLEDL